MSTLILLRHGQSMWNRDNLFTGWVDVPLSSQGIEEALNAGKTLANMPIDCIYTSLLARAQQTAMIAMSNHNSGKVPVFIHEEAGKMQENTQIYSKKSQENTIPTYTDWRLNERYYGKLQGANKQEAREQYGEDQIKIWRRSYDVPPPEGESLEMTAERTLPCLHEHIIPKLEAGQTILVSAHGNSLRSIIMDIENLSKEQVLELEVRTGDPMIYTFKDKQFTKMD